MVCQLAAPATPTARATQPSYARHLQLLRPALVHQPVVVSGTGRLDKTPLALRQIQVLQLPSQSPDAPEAVCAARSVEPGELLPVMRKVQSGHVKERRTDSPRAGFTLSQIGASRAGRLLAGVARSWKATRR